MKTNHVLVLIGVTAILSVGGTVLAREILGDELPVEGALPGQMRSTVLGENREYFVYLPDGYGVDTTSRYPVLYVLDGTSQSGHTAESAALVARLGLAPPMIVVGVPSINGDTRNRDYTPPEMRLDTDAVSSPMGAADRFLAFLQTELIPAIDRAYRTTRPRMLAGWSRGGLLVLYSSVETPSLFDGRFAHSPALWREDDRIVTRLEQALRTGTVSAGLLYLSLGGDENEKMMKAFQHAVGVLEQAAPPTLRWRADLSAGGRHESNPRLSTPVGLCVMFADVTGQACRGAGIIALAIPRAEDRR